MRRRNNAILAAIIITIVTLIGKFIKRAYKAGRLLEFIISVPLLVGAYYLYYTYYESIPWWIAVIPAGVFSAYWFCLLRCEKITSNSANPQWADRKWWWKLDGWEFEEETAKIFRLNGYKVHVTQKTSDGGIDLLMYKNGKKVICQCKHYSSPVSVSVARELNGLKEDFKADELILIASSGVTKSCKDFIQNKPYFKIFNLEDIIRMGLRPYSL